MTITTTLETLETEAQRYGYTNHNNVTPIVYEDFRDSLTLLAAILAEHESMSSRYSVEVFAGHDDTQVYCINHYDPITGYIMTGFIIADDSARYSGFIHIGG